MGDAERREPVTQGPHRRWGRVGTDGERLGQVGMVAMIRRQRSEGLRGEELLRAAVSEVRDLNGGELTDDVALVLLDRTP